MFHLPERRKKKFVRNSNLLWTTTSRGCGYFELHLNHTQHTDGGEAQQTKSIKCSVCQYACTYENRSPTALIGAFLAKVFSFLFFSRTKLNDVTVHKQAVNENVFMGGFWPFSNLSLCHVHAKVTSHTAVKRLESVSLLFFFIFLLCRIATRTLNSMKFISCACVCAAHAARN